MERLHVVWPSDALAWDFEVTVGAAPAGLVLRRVSFRGHPMLDKASVPVLLRRGSLTGAVERLELSIDGAWAAKSEFGTPHIAVDRAMFGDEVVLSVGAGFTVGPHWIYQRYYFHGDGRLRARLWVRNGETLPGEHFADHVAFLRLDLDVDGAPADRVAQFDLVEGEWKETTLPVETTANRRPRRRVFRQMDTHEKRGVWILPGLADGSSDTVLAPMAKHDLWFVRYQSIEDRDGFEGGLDDAWLDAQVNGKLLMSADVVTWYAARVPHPHEWLAAWSPPCGPDLVPFDWWPPPEAGGGSPGGDPDDVTSIPPTAILEGRIKHWRSSSWALHEKGTDTFDIDLPPGAGWARIELADEGLWGTYSLDVQPVVGATGRVRVVVGWHRPMWGHVEYRYKVFAHHGFVHAVADTVSTDLEKDVRPFSTRLGPAGAGGADYACDWVVRQVWQDF